LPEPIGQPTGINMLQPFAKGVDLPVTEVAPPSAVCPQLVLRDEWTPLRSLAGAMWRSRDLCVMLARKDFFVRYRRASLGVFWAVALPALQAVVLAVVLSRIVNISVEHYPVFIFSGIVGWTYFSTTLAAGATSIVDNSELSSRIYFPRALLPLSVCLSNVFALAVGVTILLLVAPLSGLGLGWHTFYLIPASMLIFAVAVGLTLVSSAVHVYFRDAKYIVQAALLVWFYLTPIFYPLGQLDGLVRLAVELNPITGAVEMFHAGVIAGYSPALLSTVATLAWTGALIGLAAVLHCRNDRRFADLM